MDRPCFLKPSLQNYDWGRPDYIPDLLDQETTGTPVAEAWFGAHPKAPSLVTADGKDTPLSDLVTADPRGILGQRVHETFATFPFLLKILSAARPLSVQVHPTRAQAVRGFARQVEDPSLPRCYVDENHKPELLVALTEFTALCGFRHNAEIKKALDDMPEFAALLPKLDETALSLRRLVAAYYALSDEMRTEALLAWVERLEAHSVDSKRVEFWVLRAHRTFSPEGGADPGLFFFALLNFVTLQPGQAIYLSAGILHAYLEGSGVEVMASSDNVLRGGLTNKPVFVEELLSVARFDSTQPWVLAGTPNLSAGHSPRVVEYETPAKEFAVTFYDFDSEAECTLDANGPQVLLALGARHAIRLRSKTAKLRLAKGQSCLVPDGVSVTLDAAAGTRVVCVSVPKENKPTFRGQRPIELGFGTSGLRGLVRDITDLEATIAVRGFLDFLVERGELLPGESLALAGDLRPSTDGGERSILRVVAKAIYDAGFSVKYFGRIPSPALMGFAVEHGMASVMVTGSHIPFDRNGIKFNTRSGEVLKTDEADILRHIADVRRRLYLEPKEASPFDDAGALQGLPPLPPPDESAIDAYMARYVDFFGGHALSGVRVGVYQHSAVGRDFLPQLLTSLGAEVHAFGRSETFVPVDTEAIDEAMLQRLSVEVKRLMAEVGPLSAVVSTDGDSDRPLILGVDDAGELHFHSGDRVGMITARALAADAIVVPVSTSDAVETYFGDGVPVERTRIGSPYVLAKMAEMLGSSVSGERLVGWEANGGFLLGSDVTLAGRTLTRLPTRDAMLPIICALAASLPRERGETGADLQRAFARLPARFTSAALLDDVAPKAVQAMKQRFFVADESIAEASFGASTVSVVDRHGQRRASNAALDAELQRIRGELAGLLSDETLGSITSLKFVDGVRVRFEHGDIVHLRPSGNAPQMRVYVQSDSPERAQVIAREGALPGGLLSQLLDRALDGARADAFKRNIEHTEALLQHGSAAVIGCVSGSESARRFWEQRLTGAKDRMGAEVAVSLHEDLPVNQALGVLLAWQRLRPSLRRDGGALLAFVFGEGSRATPFTETDNGQKPAMLSFVPSDEAGTPFLPMVELAMRHFSAVEAHLRRSGFDGLVIKWGDEVQIPSVPLAGANPLFRDADIVRFLSVRPMTEDDARNKDWVGVDAGGHLTAFIPRRPLSEMAKLADRGILRREGTELIGGINLGSIAVSRVLLDALLREFAQDIADTSRSRAERPDLDPQFFTALMIARMDDAAERAGAWKTAVSETQAMAELQQNMPRILERLRGVVVGFEQDNGRKPRFVGMDFGDVFWGDIGQHKQIYEFYLSLLDRGHRGEVARALLGLPGEPDANGNWLRNCKLPADARIENSVMIDCDIRKQCRVSGSVLLGTQCARVTAEGAFDVDSIAQSLKLAPRAGAYRVVHPGEVTLTELQRLTTVFLDDDDGTQLSVQEDTELRDRRANYDTPIHGNAVSFARAHDTALRLEPEVVKARRQAARRRVLAALDDSD